MSHSNLLEKSDELKAQKLVGDKSLKEILKEHHGQIRWMLQQHARKWNSKLGEITATKHRIELLPEAIPVRSQPYCQDQRDRQFEDETVTKLLKEGAIDPLKSE